jgi:hypothetical protein
MQKIQEHCREAHG